MKKQEIICGLVVVAGSAALYASLPFIKDPRAITFPRIVIMSMGILGAGLILQAAILLFSSGKPPHSTADDSPAIRSFPWKPVLTVLTGIIVYMVIMQHIGFYVSTFIYFTGIIFSLSYKDLNLKKSVKTGIMSFAFTTVLFVLFNVILKVQMPRGIFF
ncbi:MAG: tripartite tricarboxylate transporter TctB family protein [Desulfotignum sp.]|nr:tripartite tricarboxylate transporter TctB family protein [Desulfotignum sp.]